MLALIKKESSKNNQPGGWLTRANNQQGAWGCSLKWLSILAQHRSGCKPNISSRRSQFHGAFLSQDLNPWKYSSCWEVSGCRKHKCESKSASRVFISRFISAVRVVCRGMTKLAVWIMPQRGGICTNSSVLTAHWNVLCRVWFGVSVESFAVRHSSECSGGRCHVMCSCACHQLGGHCITGWDEEQLSWGD